MELYVFVRYPGDSYAGGNPWQLLTAAHAELFYLGAEAALKRGPHMRLVKFGDKKMTTCVHCIYSHHKRLVEEQAAWADVFGISHNSTQVGTPVRAHS